MSQAISVADITYDHIERLMHAVEGECDGLAIDAGQSMAILAHVFGPISPPAVPGEVETAQDFTPGVIENTEAGISALVIKDGPTVTGQEMTVRPLLDMETRQIVGFQWDIPFHASPEQGETE